MKNLGYILLLLAALFYVMPGVIADDDEPRGHGKKDGGGKLDEPEEEKEKKAEPATFTFKDYRLELTAKDGRWWKHNRKYTENDKEQNTVLKLRFKLPKSDEIFDSDIYCRAISHKLKLTWEDGTAIAASSSKRLVEKFYEIDMENWKEVRDATKPKKLKKLGGLKKLYMYSFIAQHPQANIPMKKVCYVFINKDFTYQMNVLYTTGAAKNKRVTSEVDALLKSIKVRKKKRR